jgi:hypothetical protein
MHRLLIWCFVVSFFVGSSQNKSSSTYLDINYFKGTIPLHNTDILHLIQGHPEGFIVGWNHRTNGKKEWQQRYNYPDYGASFMYQDLKNEVLGNTFGFYGHFNFYFFKRQLMLRVGQGFVVATNPYDKASNPKNIAFGSKILGSPYLMANYKKPNFLGPIGLQTGLVFFHASNGNFRAPNTSVNTIAFNIGINYDLDTKEVVYEESIKETIVDKTFKYNFVLRSGVSQTDVVGSEQFPFYTLSTYVDKRINFFSAFQLGVEAFFSKALQQEIHYRSVAFPENPSDPNADYKRLGGFLGYELFVNNWSVVAQLGYYLYYPYDFEGRIYNRIGLKYYFSEKWFGAFSVKSHIAKAETLEFGIGIRL